MGGLPPNSCGASPPDGREKIVLMSDDTPKPTATPGKIRIGGLGPKAQKLQALRDKAAGKAAPKTHDLHNASGKGASGFKKTAFQRKSV